MANPPGHTGKKYMDGTSTLFNVMSWYKIDIKICDIVSFSQTAANRGKQSEAYKPQIIHVNQ